MVDAVLTEDDLALRAKDRLHVHVLAVAVLTDQFRAPVGDVPGPLASLELDELGRCQAVVRLDVRGMGHVDGHVLAVRDFAHSQCGLDVHGACLLAAGPELPPAHGVDLGAPESLRVRFVLEEPDRPAVLGDVLVDAGDVRLGVDEDDVVDAVGGVVPGRAHRTEVDRAERAGVHDRVHREKRDDNAEELHDALVHVLLLLLDAGPAFDCARLGVGIAGGFELLSHRRLFDLLLVATPHGILAGLLFEGSLLGLLFGRISSRAKVILLLERTDLRDDDWIDGRRSLLLLTAVAHRGEERRIREKVLLDLCLDPVHEDSVSKENIRKSVDPPAEPLGDRSLLWRT